MDSFRPPYENDPLEEEEEETVEEQKAEVTSEPDQVNLIQPSSELTQADNQPGLTKSLLTKLCLTEEN